MMCQLRNSDMNKLTFFTIKRFLGEGMVKSTIYDVLYCVTNNLSYQRKKGSGSEAKKKKK